MTPTLTPAFAGYAHPVTGGQLLYHLETQSWLEVTPARKELFMSAEPREYTYGKGENARTYKSVEFTPMVENIRQLLNRGWADEKRSDDMKYPVIHGYDLCFLNRYDDQFNQLGWHADDSPEMDPEHPIAVLSVGAEREIWVRPNGHKGEIPPEWRYKLPSGSVFVMPAGFQQTHQHKIPKCDRACGMRISMTFRKYRKPPDPREAT